MTLQHILALIFKNNPAFLGLFVQLLPVMHIHGRIMCVSKKYSITISIDLISSLHASVRIDFFFDKKKEKGGGGGGER